MELVRYYNAKQAVAEYKTVDDLKDFRDKAVAVQAYARQANDYELERDAAIARVRAERKCGELLKEMNLQEKTKNNLRHSSESNGTTPTKTLSEMGVTKDQSSKWQKLANIPEKEFEEVIQRNVVDNAAPVSASQVMDAMAPKKETPKMNKTALWLWGNLREMESKHLFDNSLAFYLDEMTDGMRPDADRIIPKLREWLNDN